MGGLPYWNNRHLHPFYRLRTFIVSATPRPKPLSFIIHGRREHAWSFLRTEGWTENKDFLNSSLRQWVFHGHLRQRHIHLFSWGQRKEISQPFLLLDPCSRIVGHKVPVQFPSPIFFFLEAKWELPFTLHFSSEHKNPSTGVTKIGKVT